MTNKYRLLIIAIFCYYITDALWGLFAGLNWIPVLFIDTTIYYVAMALAITWFYKYIVEYLEMKGTWAKVFESFAKNKTHAGSFNLFKIRFSALCPIVFKLNKIK